MKKGAIFIYILILFGSCNTKNSSTPVVQEYRNKSIRVTRHSSGATIFHFFDEKYIATFLNYQDKGDSNKVKRIIFGRLLGKFYGHNFEFNKEYKLNRYRFDVGDGKHYSYEVYFTNNQYLETGNPFVDYWKDESYSAKDSTRYILYFSNFPRKEIKVSYSNDSVHYQDLPLEQSNMMPFLSETKFILPNVAHQRIINLKIKTQDLLYYLEGLPNSKVFFSYESFDN